MTLEEFKLITLIWGGVGIVASLVTRLYLKLYQKKHPTFMTDFASPQEAQKSRKIVLFFLSGAIIYVMLLLLVATLLSYDKPPLVPVILCCVMILGVISFVIAALKGK